MHDLPPARLMARAALIAALLSGCAIGRVTPERVEGIAFGEAQLSACPTPPVAAGEDGLVDPPGCMTIRGGALSVEASHLLGAAIGAVAAYFGMP